MKNKKLLLAPILLVAAAVASLPLLVGAAPSFPPPTGLTDAQFNTISVGTGSGGNAKMVINASGQMTNDPHAFPLLLKDNNGFQFSSDSGTSIRFQANYIDSPLNGYISMQKINVDQGLFNGRQPGIFPVAIVDNDGISIGNDSGANYLRIWNDGWNSYLQSQTGGVQIMDSDGLILKDNSGSIKAEIWGTGTILTSGDVYANSGWVTANTIHSYGTLSNAGLNIASDGTVSDNSGAVTVNDPNGLTITQGTVTIGGGGYYGGMVITAPGWGGLTINNAGTGGQTINATSGGLTINSSSGGLIINATSAGGILLNTTGGIVNAYAGQGVNINDDLNVSGTIYDGSGNLTVIDTIDLTGSLVSNGTVQAQGLVATNGLTATNYIGTSGYIYTGGNISSGGNVTASNGDIGAGTGFPSARVHGTGSTYGVRGDGSTMGGHFTDSDSGSYAYVAYGASGIAAYGNTQGGYFYDNDSAINTRVAYGTYSLYGTGSANLLQGGSGAALSVNGAEALWYNSDYFSWGYGGNWNYFADRVQIGTTGAYSGFMLTVNGAAQRTGSTAWSTFSDIRLKNVLGDYEKGLEEVLKLNPVRYTYKKDNPKQLISDVEYLGFVAQDVKDIFPEAVSEDPDGYLVFDTHAVNVAVINAIKELKQEKDSEVAELKAELAEMKAVVCEIKPTAEYCEQ